MIYCKDMYRFMLLLLLIAGCAAEKEKQRQVGFEEAFQLAASDTVQLKQGSESFWISLEEIEDNRCPADVNCITGGKAVVRLQLAEMPEQVEICIGADCRGENKNFFLYEYNNRRYTIVLEEVVPYPQTGNETNAKQAILKIKRATS